MQTTRSGPRASLFRGYGAALAATFLALAGCSLYNAAEPEQSGEPVTFRLAYQPEQSTTDAIFVLSGCSQGWVRLVGPTDEVISLDSDCGVCRCDSCNPCAICDCAARIDPIPAGGALDHAWDGTTHPLRNSPTCGVCETDGVLTPGVHLARFCYTRTIDGPLECDDVPFEYPARTGVVEHVVRSR